MIMKDEELIDCWKMADECTTEAPGECTHEHATICMEGIYNFFEG